MITNTEGGSLMTKNFLLVRRYANKHVTIHPMPSAADVDAELDAIGFNGLGFVKDSTRVPTEIDKAWITVTYDVAAYAEKVNGTVI